MYYKYFKIQTKNATFEPFKPNLVQKHFNKNKTNRNIILKSRQHGTSTGIKMDDLEAILTRTDYKCFTIADNVANASALLQKVTTAWNNLPGSFKAVFKEKYQSVNQLYLDAMRSGIYVGTSGRSGTVQKAHISEFAFLKEKESQEVQTGTLNSVPKDGQIDIESTAFGYNHFKEWWDDAVAGKNGYTPFFYGWTWDKFNVMQPPLSKSWKSEYKQLAQDYGLIEDIETRASLTEEQFYWYFMTARVQKKFMRQEYPTFATEAFVSSGKAVFDLFKIAQLKVARPEFLLFDIIKVWRQPVEGHSYIVGMDTAEGVGGDSSALAVLDATTNDFVAEFRSNEIEPQDFARLGVDLAKIYNNAFIIPERNASGLTTTVKIQELGYLNLFINTVVDKIHQSMRDEYGWRTSSANRDLMIDEFREALHEGLIGEFSADAKAEYETFTVKTNGRREHADKKHDDLLFARFLAWQGKKFNKSNFIFIKGY